MSHFDEAQILLNDFKGDKYLHGMGVLQDIGSAVARLGKNAALVSDVFPGADPYLDIIRKNLKNANVELSGEVKGARPNAPREDLNRITAKLSEINPDVIISFGGGSTIDAAKSAEVLRTLGDDIEHYFGTGLVTEALFKNNKLLTPHVAIQTAASSGAHLTKYSNITDLKTGQKKLIVDESIVPIQPVFDYEVTLGAPASLTADGGLDGIAHSLEVLYGAVGKPFYTQTEKIAKECISLVIRYLPTVLKNPMDREGREALGLATDLGGYAIMIGGTNGGHLTSFSLVDILSHGRACAILNPYYTVFFAPAIQEPLKIIGTIFADAGYTDAPISNLSGRELGVAVAKAMISFEKRIGFPTTLGEVPGFSDLYIKRALKAAKDPQLKMKLENMPVPLTAEMIDIYMAPVLNAAKTGELNIIKNVE